VLQWAVVPTTHDDAAAFRRRGHATEQEARMSMLVVYALATFPTVAAVMVMATALADRQETSALNDLRELGADAVGCVADELESSAA
jgi:hypothetical protein